MRLGNIKKLITASEERREKRAKRSFSWRPSEDGTKGLIPHPSGVGESERSEHKMGAGLCPAVNTLYLTIDLTRSARASSSSFVKDGL